MITEYQVRNFKCFADTGPVRLGAITVLLGRNNSGKSSLIAHFSHPSVAGEVSCMDFGDTAAAVSVRYVIEAHLQDGSKRLAYESAFIHSEGTWRMASVRQDLDLLQRNSLAYHAAPTAGCNLDVQSRVEGAISDAIARFRSAHERVESARGRVVGVASNKAVDP
jgi:hypothetical protein